MHSPEIENKPSTKQLTELMAMGIFLGKDQDRLRTSKRLKNTRAFLPEYVETVPEKGELALNNVYRYIGKISRKGFNRSKVWSMCIAEAGYLFDGSDLSDSYRCNYVFEWAERRTIRSDRRIFLPEEDEIDLGFMPEQIDEIMFQPDALHAVNQLQTVSAADVEELAQNIRQFGEASRCMLSYDR